MNMIDSVAQMATNMSNSQLAVQYSLSVTKKAMDSQEQLALNLLQQMMPQTPQPPMGQYIDTYA